MGKMEIIFGTDFSSAGNSDNFNPGMLRLDFSDDFNAFLSRQNDIGNDDGNIGILGKLLMSCKAVRCCEGVNTFLFQGCRDELKHGFIIINDQYFHTVNHGFVAE